MSEGNPGDERSLLDLSAECLDWLTHWLQSGMYLPVDGWSEGSDLQMRGEGRGRAATAEPVSQSAGQASQSVRTGWDRLPREGGRGEGMQCTDEGFAWPLEGQEDECPRWVDGSGVW